MLKISWEGFNEMNNSYEINDSTKYAFAFPISNHGEHGWTCIS